MRTLLNNISFIALGAALQGFWSWWVDQRRIKRGKAAVERWKQELNQDRLNGN